MTIREDCIIEIYTKNQDSFSVGKVCFQNHDSVVFYSIDEQGKIAGYYAMKKKYITKILDNTEYLRKIGKYMEYSEKNPYDSWFSLKKVEFEISKPLFIQILRYAKDNDIIVTLDMFISDYLETGYVREITQEKIVLECVDVGNARIMDKVSIEIEIESIAFIEFESIDNRLLQYAMQKVGKSV
ncbi:MAG: hypothetical protein PUC12_10035 [Clostridiales bacterium]|nr:hypothetical protein [Clostridiales bacterium]